MTTREALDQIDTLIAGLDFDGQQNVLHVLTALRGPDSEHHALKLNTTAVIRSKALPKTFAPKDGESLEDDLYARTGQFVNPSATKVDFRDSAKRDHFYYHAVLAAQALGMEVSDYGD